MIELRKTIYMSRISREAKIVYIGLFFLETGFMASILPYVLR